MVVPRASAQHFQPPIAALDREPWPEQSFIHGPLWLWGPVMGMGTTEKANDLGEYEYPSSLFVYYFSNVVSLYSIAG